MQTKLENLWKLHDAAWASFQRRASHEFKFALAVWTAAVVLIGLALKEDVHPVPWWLAVAGCGAFVVLHWWYECGMARSNDTDLAKCYELQAAILAEIGHTWSPKLEERVGRHKIPALTGAPSEEGRARRCWRWASKHWSHIGHVGGTAVLAAMAAFLLIAPTPPRPQSDMSTTKITVVEDSQNKRASITFEGDSTRIVDLERRIKAIPGP